MSGELEWVYACITGFTFLTACVWYLILHPEIVDGLKERFLAWLPRAAENYRQDLEKSKELVRRMTKVRCENCDKEIGYLITIRGKHYCFSCAMSSDIFAQAQAQYQEERK
jgi:hypothetical protein